MAMVLEIPKKPGSSNKTKTLSFPAPFVDKISIVLRPKLADAAEIHALAYQALTNDQDFFQSAGKATPSFKIAKFVVIAGYVDRPRIDYAFNEGTATQLRIEFNPSRYDEKGLAIFAAILSTLVPGGWAYLATEGKISRIDIAVDLPGVRMNHFLFMPNQAATNMAWRFAHTGFPETITHGKPAGNQIVIYNKKIEQNAKAKSHAKKWQGPSTLRVESKRRNTGLTVSTLATMANPFANMVLAISEPPPPNSKIEWLWTLVIDSANKRGLENALSLLKPARRTQFRAHLKGHQHAQWDAKKIWEGWPGHLKQLGWS